MAQTWDAIDASETLKDTRTQLTGRDETLKSSFSGTAFPTTDLLVGMLCYRTDLEELYQLRSTGPSVWVLIAKLGSTYLSQQLGDARYALISHAHSGADITSGTVAAARLPTELQNIKTLTPGAGASSVGSIDIDNINGSYAGIHFSHASIARKFMVSSTIQGIQNAADNTWTWQWTSGSLTAGSVPWARLTSVPTNSLGNRTVSTSAPSGGADGDIWLRY